MAHSTPQISGPVIEELTRLWQEAVENFKKDKQVKPEEWNVTLQKIASCSSVEDICGVLEQDFFNKFKEARGNEKWRTLREKYLKPAVDIILKFNDVLAGIAGSFVRLNIIFISEII